jgi:hypothetical protein
MNLRICTSSQFVGVNHHEQRTLHSSSSGRSLCIFDKQDFAIPSAVHQSPRRVSVTIIANTGR